MNGYTQHTTFPPSQIPRPKTNIIPPSSNSPLYVCRYLASSLTKLPRPVLILLQTRLRDRRTDVDKTALEIGELNRSDLVG